MNNLVRKISSMGDLKYGSILLVSIAVCGATFYADRRIDPDDQFWLTVSYAFSFALAVLWGAVNYIGHLRLNALYRKQSDIRAYTEQLALSGDDRTELQNYLEDYVGDLVKQGRTKEEAVREAIAQFQVKELLSLSKHSAIFDLHAHYYLIGWAIAAFVALAVAGAFGAAFPASLPLLIVECILLAYSLGLIGLFFVYKLLDAFLHRKLHNQMT